MRNLGIQLRNIGEFDEGSRDVVIFGEEYVFEGGAK